MLFNLHADYIKAVADPRTRPSATALMAYERSEPPPRPVRASIARALAGAARRLDRETARRALA